MFSAPLILYNTRMSPQAPVAAPESESDLRAGTPHTASAALVVSQDGYLRLTLSAFRAIALRHLFSGLDTDTEAPDHYAAGASAASILGFTEWVSETTPAVSLGWDWRLDTNAGTPRYVRDGEVRSNIMLIEPGLGDLGDLATSATLSAAVDALSWAAETNHYITNNYGWHLSNLTVTPD
jgi:hypothetical protein